MSQDKMAMKFAASVQNMGFLTSVDKRARSLFSLDSDELERSRSYFVCPNGTLDLDTGRFIKSVPRHYNVHMSSVVYNPAAEAPSWIRFLSEITEGDADLQAYLQRAVGYTLSGHTGEQCMFLLHGAGANGKSVFLAALRGLFGEYGHVIRSDSLMLGNANRIPSDLAQLQYARYVETQESELGARMAEGLIKSVTGGEAISARHLYGEWFSFRPRFKLWMATNHKPEVHGTDQGIWRRLRLIPFQYEVPHAQRDTMLAEKLALEASGILNWAAEGYRWWKKIGLSEPGKIRAATQEYRDEMDPILPFLMEVCDISENSQAFARDLYKSYKGFVEEEGGRPMSKKRFSMTLAERGFPRTRDHHGIWFVGLRPKI